jgi:DNA mismatch endonuclease (patch repair protein)
MADKLTPERRSENMRRIKSKGMKPEMVVRRMAHKLGYRFRLHRRDLPGKPDMAFVGKRKAIFVHGCFWHQHRYCREGRMPGSNETYWKPKLTRNVERDAANLAMLAMSGWRTLVIWECETKNIATLKRRPRKFLG